MHLHHLLILPRKNYMFSSSYIEYFHSSSSKYDVSKYEEIYLEIDLDYEEG